MTLIDLVRARAADPAIDAAMLEVDELSRLLAINAVTAAAAAGDMKAIKALIDGTLDVLTQGLTPAEPPAVLKAMADAKRRVLAGDDPRAWRIEDVVCPCCREQLTLEIHNVLGAPGQPLSYDILLIQYGAADGSTRSRWWSSREDPLRRATGDDPLA